MSSSVILENGGWLERVKDSIVTTRILKSEERDTHVLTYLER